MSRRHGSSKRLKSKRPLSDLYGEGLSQNLMKAEYAARKDIQNLIQKRHRSGTAYIDPDGVWHRGGHDWPVPYGVRMGMKTPLIHAQIVTRYPWMATWVSPKTGKRMKKKFQSLPAAIDFVASKAQYVDSEASVYSRHGFYIPTKLMGKFPRPWGTEKRLHYWCPRCMQPRTFRRNGEEFYGTKKFWNDDKARYDWKNVKLAVVCCTHCGITNRDHKFRASNQPLETRRFKPGVRRARRRKK